MTEWLALINWPRLTKAIAVAIVAQVIAEIVKVRREIGLA